MRGVEHRTMTTGSGFIFMGRAPLSRRSMVEYHRPGFAEWHAGHVQPW
jgi:hypothetical protein